MNTNGPELINALVSDPRLFTERGLPYELLQAYFRGYAVDSLRPLLQSRDTTIQRAATFVTSELGRAAAPIIGDVLRLVDSDDLVVAYQVLETIAVCCEAELADGFVHVVRALEHPNATLRGLALRLVNSADESQLVAASKGLLGTEHIEGLSTLLRTEESVGNASRLLKSPSLLLRRYGAILAARSGANRKELVAALGENLDEELGRFLADLS